MAQQTAQRPQTGVHHEQAAHLLRRSSLAVQAEQVDAMAALVEDSWDAAVESVLRSANKVRAQPFRPPTPSDDAEEEIITWWISQLTGPANGLNERMAWFWHGVLTTSIESVDVELIGPQLEVLHTNALGNFRELLHQFVRGGALLQYLNGDGSQAFNPNENLARELMELFTVGRGNYSQDDVRVAARALAGWYVEDGIVGFDREAAFNAPAIFRGTQADWDTQSIVDALCDDPLTAINISGKVWADLVGTSQTERQQNELGRWWHEQGLDIASLVEHILRSTEFREAVHSRPRSAFEWWAATTAATGIGLVDLWDLVLLGQTPYRPPNVGGWPGGQRWLTPGSMLNRASFVFGIDDFEGLLERATTTQDILRQCSLLNVSESTYAAFDRADEHQDLDPESLARLRWRIALSCPEFNIQ